MKLAKRKMQLVISIVTTYVRNRTEETYQVCREGLAYLCQLFVEPEEYPRIFPSAIQEQKIEFAALGPC